MNTERWDVLSAWLNEWLAADDDARARLRARLAAERPDLVAEADALARASRELQGFLETPALVLEAPQLAQEDPLLAAGAVVGPYRIAHLLARGGTGDVYRATDLRLRRDVAVKVLAQSRTSDPHRVERFMHEARLTASLDHPNIVRVYDVGKTAEHTYLVAELLEGETLRGRIAGGPMPVEDVLRIGLEIAHGLAAAHAAGLVHRDLKPDNIFLTQAGGTKILDFGIAKLAEGEASGNHFSTMTGVVLGTAGYLAPEQIRGQAVDARADLFALGTVLFEMLTGERAFGREHMVETLHAILHDPPSSALEARDDVPPVLQHIVKRLLEKAPDLRFESAAEVIAALRHCDATATARPVKRRAARWRRVAATAMVGAAVLLLAGLAVNRKWLDTTTVARDQRAVDAYLAGRATVLRPTPDDLRNAAKYFSEAIAIDPKYADAWAGLASAYKRMPQTAAAESNEAFGKARDAANRALAIEPRNAEAICALGTIAFWYDWDYAGAERYLKEAISVQPDHADSHLFLGMLYSSVGRPDEALTEIRAARNFDRQWPQPRAIEGATLNMARRYQDGLKHLDAVVRDIDPTLWTAHLFRANALFGLGRADEALAATDEVIKLRPHHSAIGLRGYLLARMNRVTEAEAALARIPADAPVSRALVLHALGRNDEAIAALHAAVDQRSPLLTAMGVDPKWDRLRRWQPFREVVRRVNLLEVSDRTAERYAAAPAARDERAVNAYRLGRATVRRPMPDDLENAAKYFGEAIAIDPNYADAWAGLASAYKRLPIIRAAHARDAFPKARAAANRALALDPDNAEALSALGTIAFWYDWDYTASENYLKRALSIQPDHPDSHLFLGHLYANTGRAGESLLEIRLAQQFDQQWAQPRALEGMFLFMARRYDDALKHLEAMARTVDPTLWTTHYFRADTLAMLGREDAALGASDELLKLGRRSASLSLRGYLLARMNRPAEAEACLAQLSPDDHYQRALTLHALGRNEEALTRLHAAVDRRMPHVTFVGVDPKWDGLRRWQPFRDLARRVNLLEVSDRTAERFVPRR